MRVHVFGASGSGTTTLGRALASRLCVPHHDTDEFYWAPTPVSFTTKRPVDVRLELMEAMFLTRPSWVLSGSVVSWSETLIPYFDVAVFLSLDNELRLNRIRAREVMRYGEAALSPTGKRYAAYQDFMAWNAGYESSTFKGRSRKVHEDWIASLPCPVIRLDSANDVSELVAEAGEKISKVENEKNHQS